MKKLRLNYRVVVLIAILAAIGLQLIWVEKLPAVSAPRPASERLRRQRRRRDDLSDRSRKTRADRHDFRGLRTQRLARASHSPRNLGSQLRRGRSLGPRHAHEFHRGANSHRRAALRARFFARWTPRLRGLLRLERSSGHRLRFAANRRSRPRRTAPVDCAPHSRWQNSAGLESR